MLILNAKEVRQALPMVQTIAAMKAAFAALSAGRAELPLRIRLPIDSHQAVNLIMPAYVQDKSGDSLTVKIISVYPENALVGLPIIHAAVLVIDSGNGRILALLEGGTLTAIRTGAGSGAATDLLARPDSRVAAIFGAGVQARTQLEAICSVRSIETVWIYSPVYAQVKEFISDMSGKGSIPTNLRAASSPQKAIADADIISAATTSSTPVFDDADLKPGVHINAVGSYTPEMQEIPSETIKRALVTVDSREAVLAETGDLIKPIQDGMIDADHIHAEIGEIISKRKAGRQDDLQITYFKSVGVAVQDALAGRLALENGVKFSLGQHIDL